MLRVAMVTGCHAPQESGRGGGGARVWGGRPSETTITGSVRLAACSLLQSGYF